MIAIKFPFPFEQIDEHTIQLDAQNIPCIVTEDAKKVLTNHGATPREIDRFIEDTEHDFTKLIIFKDMSITFMP